MPELITELPQRPVPPFAPRSGQPEVRPRMLFAASDFVQALPALRRAQGLAERAGAELYVLQVGPTARTPQTPHRAPARASAQGLRRLCNRGGHERLARDHILLLEGEFTKVVSHTARSLAASLVVIGGTRARPGKRVVQIVKETHVPVLVSRRSNHSGVLLAALDLLPQGDAEELALCAELAQRLAFRLALVHNVQPVVNAVSSPAGHTFCSLIQPSRAELHARHERIERLAGAAGVHAEAIVRSEPSAEAAILASARAQGAELIAVGLRDQGFIERLFHTALAMRIVDRSERSVLVAPVAA